jgi:hypothetical protein
VFGVSDVLAVVKTRLKSELSGQAETKAVVEQSPVLYESANGRVEAIEQSVNQHRQDTAFRRHHPRDWCLARSPHSKVRAQLVATMQESPDQRLRYRMTYEVRACLAHGLQKGVARDERPQKNSENAGTMLAPRQAEVREQRHRLAGDGAAESPHPDSHYRPLVWQQRLASVPAMQPQPMCV